MTLFARFLCLLTGGHRMREEWLLWQAHPGVLSTCRKCLLTKYEHFATIKRKN
jgi:hypothetical protein